MQQERTRPRLARASASRWRALVLGAVLGASAPAAVAITTLTPTPAAAAELSPEEIAELRAVVETGLTSEQSEVRRVSILALGAMLTDKELKDFRKYLEDTDPVVRQGALVALALRGDKKAIKGIQEALAAAEPDAVDALVVELVQPLDDSVQSQIFEQILKKPANEPLRQAVVGFVMRLGTDAQIDAVAASLGKIKDAAVRDAVLDVVVKHPRERSLTIAEWALGSSDATVRARALDLAVAIDSHDAKQLVAKALGDADETVVSKAEALLLEMRHPAAVGVLEKRLEENPRDFETVKTLLEFETSADLAARLEPLVAKENPGLDQADYNQVLALVAASKTDAAKALIQARLGSSYETDRIAAAYALGYTGDTSMTSTATGLLDDGSAAVRQAAAWTLGKLGDASALDAMQTKLQAGTTSREVKLNLVRSMGEIGDPKAANALQFLMTERDVELRMAAVDALAELKASDATRAIELVAKDPDATVRWQATAALFRIDPVVYGERLKKAVPEAPESAFFATLDTLDDETRLKLEDEVLRSDRAALAAKLVEAWSARGREGLPRLRTALELATDKDVVQPAFYAIATYAEPDDLERISTFLTHEDRKVRLTALRTLLRYDAAATEASFRSQLDSDDPLMKALAIYGLTL